MSEDAREIAHRIVQEVLAAHEAAEAGPAATAGSEAAEPGPLAASPPDLRETSGAAAPDTIADALDDSPARQAARRIVAEVLAAHAEASRSTEHELPVAAEAEPAGPASAAPVLQPQAGHPGVLPAVPETPSLDPDAHVAEDSVAIARRIVASVLSQHTVDGPPPIPSAVLRPVMVDDPAPPRIIEEPDPQPDGIGADGDESDGAEPRLLVIDEPDAEPVEPLDDLFTADPLDGTRDDGDAPGDQVGPAMAPVVAHGSYALPMREPAEAAVDDADSTELLASQSADTTAVLAPDPDESPDATARVSVATLAAEPEPEADRRNEPTVAIPSAVAPRRTGRWLLASILGAVALAVLLPLAIGALRTLVAFS